MEKRALTMDWSLILMLGFPIVYMVIIYRHVTSKYGVVAEEE